MEKFKCALCDSDNYKIILKVKDYRYNISDDEFNLVQCKNCGLVYVNPRLSKEEIINFYPCGYYPSGSIIARVVKYLFLKAKIRKIRRYKKLGRIVDIGCGGGDFIFEMNRAGFEVFGIDPSAEACQIARQKLENRNRIYNCELGECVFPNKFFDVVTLWHVIEHLPHPKEVLKEVHRILKEKGILILSLPNINSFAFDIFGRYWFHLDIPRHLYHFSTKTIRNMLELTGFQVIGIRYFSLSFPFSLFHSALNWLKDYSMPPLLVWLLFVIMFPFIFILTLILFILSFSGKSKDIEVYCSKKR